MTDRAHILISVKAALNAVFRVPGLFKINTADPITAYLTRNPHGLSKDTYSLTLSAEH